MDLSDSEKKSHIIKMHKLVGHASTENNKHKTSNNNAGLFNKGLNAIIENVVQSYFI